MLGSSASFFKVKMAEEGHYWFAGGTESHLTANLGVIVEPNGDRQNRFHVLTIVHYHQLDRDQSTLM